MSKQRGIYCIECWSTNPRNKLSMKPILDLLYNAAGIRHIYRKVATKAEFIERLREFTFARYKSYMILYIATHGERGKVLIGKEEVTLSEISERFKGCLKDCIVHFGSCSTLRAQKRIIDDFMVVTGASLLTGFRRQVDFIESSAEELSYFYQM